MCNVSKWLIAQRYFLIRIIVGLILIEFTSIAPSRLIETVLSMNKIIFALFSSSFRISSSSFPLLSMPALQSLSALSIF